MPEKTEEEIQAEQFRIEMLKAALVNEIVAMATEDEIWAFLKDLNKAKALQLVEAALDREAVSINERSALLLELKDKAKEKLK